MAATPEGDEVQAPAPAEFCATSIVEIVPASPDKGAAAKAAAALAAPTAAAMAALSLAAPPQLKASSSPVKKAARAAAVAERARGVACFIAVGVLTCSYSLLLEAAKSADGTFAFSPLSVTFVAEAAKLLISLAAVRAAPQPPPPLRLGDCARAAVPAVLYMVQNNAVFVAMRHLTPPLYQLLSNLKIVATALLTRLILQRALTHLQVRCAFELHWRRALTRMCPRALHAAAQWAGVALLALASALPGIAAFAADDGAAAGALSHRDLMLGTAVMFFIATTSGAKRTSATTLQWPCVAHARPTSC